MNILLFTFWHCPFNLLFFLSSCTSDMKTDFKLGSDMHEFCWTPSLNKTKLKRQCKKLKIICWLESLVFLHSFLCKCPFKLKLFKLGGNNRCFYKPGTGTSNPYYRNVGLLNTNEKVVTGATVGGRAGGHRGDNPYFAFDLGRPIDPAEQVLCLGNKSLFILSGLSHWVLKEINTWAL